MKVKIIIPNINFLNLLDFEGYTEKDAINFTKIFLEYCDKIIDIPYIPHHKTLVNYASFSNIFGFSSEFEKAINLIQAEQLWISCIVLYSEYTEIQLEYDL
ncbi:MAG: hypothetical protein OEY01_11080 [Desulfobulbaceae bacterium]|nr:hypothetical protein [Desulfobulbaceae bacterium]